MYRKSNDGQFSVYDFVFPFEGHLKEDEENKFKEDSKRREPYNVT